MSACPLGHGPDVSDVHYTSICIPDAVLPCFYVAAALLSTFVLMKCLTDYYLVHSKLRHLLKLNVVVQTLNVLTCVSHGVEISLGPATATLTTLTVLATVGVLGSQTHLFLLKPTAGLFSTQHASRYRTLFAVNFLSFAAGSVAIWSLAFLVAYDTFTTVFCILVAIEFYVLGATTVYTAEPLRGALTNSRGLSNEFDSKPDHDPQNSLSRRIFRYELITCATCFVAIIISLSTVVLHFITHQFAGRYVLWFVRTACVPAYGTAVNALIHDGRRRTRKMGENGGGANGSRASSRVKGQMVTHSGTDSGAAAAIAARDFVFIDRVGTESIEFMRELTHDLETQLSFMVYAEKLHFDECVKFIVDISAWKRIYYQRNSEFRRKAALKLLNTYVRVDATQQINISHDLRAKLHENVSHLEDGVLKSIPYEIFDEALMEICNIVKPHWRTWNVTRKRSSNMSGSHSSKGNVT